jgi:hypothetical protein
MDPERPMSNEIQVDYSSGNALYAVIRDDAGQVWHVAGQAFESWGTSGHAADDYDIALTDAGGSHYVGAFDGNIPGGSYSIQVFRQVGAAPADTDPLVTSRQILWTGSGELTAAKFLVNRAVQDKVTGEIDYYDDDGQTILLTHTMGDTQAYLTREHN